MVEAVGEEGDEGAAAGWDVAGGAFARFVELVEGEAERSSRVVRPVFVQVEDQGDGACRDRAEAVEVAAVEGAGRVDGEVGLEVEETQEERGVGRLT